MKRIHIEKRKVRPERSWQEILPLDPRDPDIARAKAMVYDPGVPRSSKQDNQAQPSRGRSNG
jgi:hypothetical protein